MMRMVISLQRNISRSKIYINKGITPIYRSHSSDDHHDHHHDPIITKTSGVTDANKDDAAKHNELIKNNLHPDFMPSSKVAPRGAMENYKLNEEDGETLADLEEMFIEGPAGVEWGGPTRGGRRPEPTRYGDWERKGRTSDF